MFRGDSFGQTISCTSFLHNRIIHIVDPLCRLPLCSNSSKYFPWRMPLYRHKYLPYEQSWFHSGSRPAGIAVPFDAQCSRPSTGGWNSYGMITRLRDLLKKK